MKFWMAAECSGGQSHRAVRSCGNSLRSTLPSRPTKNMAQVCVVPLLDGFQLYLCWVLTLKIRAPKILLLGIIWVTVPVVMPPSAARSSPDPQSSATMFFKRHLRLFFGRGGGTRRSVSFERARAADHRAQRALHCCVPTGAEIIGAFCGARIFSCPNSVYLPGIDIVVGATQPRFQQ